MATGTSAVISIQSGSLMRLAFALAVACIVVVLMVLLAAGLWLVLLVAERSKRRAPQLSELKMRRPYFLSGDGLL
jgi:hypothetical protein